MFTNPQSHASAGKTFSLFSFFLLGVALWEPSFIRGPRFNFLSGVVPRFHLLPLKCEALKNNALTLRLVSGIWAADSCGACFSHWLFTLTLSQASENFPSLHTCSDMNVRVYLEEQGILVFSSAH